MLDAAVRRLPSVLISRVASIADALARLDAAGTGALVLTDESRRLWGVVTDGDIRRAILAGVPLDRACGSIATCQPLVVPELATPAEALRILDHAPVGFVNNAPVVDADGMVVGLLLRRDIVADEEAPLLAVIMAGGFGRRMLPLTERVPKPMLRVGDRPLLQRTIEHLRDAGIERVAITTHHLGQQIADHFGDGSAYGVHLEYVPEERPQGTAGALRLLKNFDQTFLVINGDILTGVRFRDILAFHREHGADATVGVRRCELEVPYGVLDCDGARVTNLREKPRLAFAINAGIYLLEPSVRRYIPEGRPFDMTDLLKVLLQNGRSIVSFPIVEYWLDIGTPADYEQSNKDLSQAHV
jgi:dTDP-glucose pyrophosphorylase/CBS domain-containing protein